jgi:hypothetical protein
MYFPVECLVVDDFPHFEEVSLEAMVIVTQLVPTRNYHDLKMTHCIIKSYLKAMVIALVVSK